MPRPRMWIDTAARTDYAPPRVRALERWTGPCFACEKPVAVGELVTWVPLTPLPTRLRTVRMQVVHVDCTTFWWGYTGESCGPKEFAWLRGLAGEPAQEAEGAQHGE